MSLVAPTMVCQEGCPRLPGVLRWHSTLRLTHVAPDSPTINTQAQLQQFTPNAFAAPRLILDGHLFNQGNGCLIQAWSSGWLMRFMPPEQLEALPMPLEQRLRLDNQQRLFPTLHATDKQYQQPTIKRCECRLFYLPLQ